jgi:hypothetical protein
MKIILTTLIFISSLSLIAQKKSNLYLDNFGPNDTIELIIQTIGDNVSYIDNISQFYIYKNGDTLKVTAYFMFDKNYVPHKITLTKEQFEYLRQLETQGRQQPETGLAHDNYKWIYKHKVFKTRLNSDNSVKLFDYFK